MAIINLAERNFIPLGMNIDGVILPPWPENSGDDERIIPDIVVNKHAIRAVQNLMLILEEQEQRLKIEDPASKGLGYGGAFCTKPAISSATTASGAKNQWYIVELPEDMLRGWEFSTESRELLEDKILSNIPIEAASENIRYVAGFQTLEPEKIYLNVMRPKENGKWEASKKRECEDSSFTRSAALTAVAYKEYCTNLEFKAHMNVCLKIFQNSKNRFVQGVLPADVKKELAENIIFTADRFLTNASTKCILEDLPRGDNTRAYFYNLKPSEHTRETTVWDDDYTLGVFRAIQKSSAKKFVRNSDDAPKIHNTDLFAAYEFNPERELTEAEKKLVPEYNEGFDQPEELCWTLEEMFESKDDIPALKCNNIFLFGPTGTGKSEFCRQVARAVNRPYLAVNCSGGTDEYTLTAQILPQTDSSATQPFKVVNSAFVEAYEKGYVVEFQEINSIDPGVAQRLNEALSDAETLRLGDRVIKRHPDTIVMFTGNVSNGDLEFANDKGIPVQLSSRFSRTLYLEAPDLDTQALRLNEASKLENYPLARKMTDIGERINAIRKEHDEQQGACDFRQLLNWAAATRRKFRANDKEELTEGGRMQLWNDCAYLCGQHTVIQNASYDPNLHAEFLNALETQFTKPSQKALAKLTKPKIRPAAKPKIM